MSFAAPDLVTPVVAFRAWRIVDGRLLSPYIPCRWEGAVMHAECYPANRALLFGRGWLAAPHDPPHPDCQCGIYAYHRPARRATTASSNGSRASSPCGGGSRPTATGCAPSTRGVRARAPPGRGAIAADLSVDLVERDELESAAGRYGAPLPAGLVP